LLSLGGGAFAVAATNGDSKAVAQYENWLTIPAIHDKVTAAGYSDISEIERERDGYEVKGRNADGERVKLYVDPLSGEVLEARAKKDNSDKRSRDDKR